jgi:hypothetical protein
VICSLRVAFTDSLLADRTRLCGAALCSRIVTIFMPLASDASRSASREIDSPIQSKGLTLPPYAPAFRSQTAAMSKPRWLDGRSVRREADVREIPD